MGPYTAVIFPWSGESKLHCDITICGIFVNPTQFNDPADFENILLQSKMTSINSTRLIPISCFAIRGGNLSLTGLIMALLWARLSWINTRGLLSPRALQGVCRVMHRLLTICQPDELYMGQKDYQQCMVVKNCCQTITSVVTSILCQLCGKPTAAMSSRNLRLSAEAKTRAAAIYPRLPI